MRTLFKIVGIVALTLATMGVSAHSLRTTQSKPGAAVSVHLEAPTNPLAAHSLARLTLRYTAPANSQLQIHYTTSNGLTLTSPDTAQLIVDAQGSALQDIYAKIQQGTAYLNVFITLDHRQRVISIPLRTSLSHQALKPYGQPVTTQSKDNLIILPAE